MLGFRVSDFRVQNFKYYCFLRFRNSFKGYIIFFSGSRGFRVYIRRLEVGFFFVLFGF